MIGRRAGFTAEDDRMARLLMSEWERVEHHPVGASRVATFADMARAVRLDREQAAARQAQTITMHVDPPAPQVVPVVVACPRCGHGGRR